MILPDIWVETTVYCQLNVLMAYSAYFKEVIQYYYCKFSPGGGDSEYERGGDARRLA